MHESDHCDYVKVYVKVWHVTMLVHIDCDFLAHTWKTFVIYALWDILLKRKHGHNMYLFDLKQNAIDTYNNISGIRDIYRNIIRQTQLYISVKKQTLSELHF